MRDFFCRKANRATRKLPFFKRINVLAAAWFQFLKEKAVFGDNRNSFHSILTEKTQAVFTGKGSMCSIWKWPYSDITTEVEPMWLLDMVPDLCRFGEVNILSCNEEGGIVKASKKLFLGDREVGTVNMDLSVSEANLIQEKQIKDAEKKGWVPLSFKKAGSGYLGTVAYAEYRGRRIEAWSSDAYGIEAGAVYYCVLENFLGETKAAVKFRVFNLHLASSEQKDEGSSVDFLKLGEKFRVKNSGKVLGLGLL